MPTVFHRLEYPDPNNYYYSAAGSIPELPTDYAWMNNEPLAGSRATASGAQSGGHSEDGSFYVCNENDATHAIANRPHQAIATSLDLLDNLFRRPIAVPTKLDDSTGGSPVSSKTISSAEMVWLGSAGTEYSSLFHIVDADGREIINSSGSTCTVTASNPPPGDAGLLNGFANVAVQLTISPAIPAGTTYRIYYAKKGSLAELPRDAITGLGIGSRAEVDGTVRKMLKNLHGGGLDWDAAWTSTIYSLAVSGLNDRYNRDSSVSTVGGGPEPELGYDLDVDGSGSWIRRNGYAPSVYKESISYSPWLDPIGAAWKAVMFYSSSLNNTTKPINGFVFYGGNYCAGASISDSHDYSPIASSFLSLDTNRMAEDSTDYANAYTYLKYGTPCTTGYDGVDAEFYVDVASPYRFHNGTNTDIQSQIDVLEVYDSVNEVRMSFLVYKLKTSTRAYLRRLDGSKPGNLGTLSGSLRWHPVRFAVSGGAAEAAAYSSLYGSHLYGMTLIGPRQHGTMAGPGQGGDGSGVAGRYGHCARFLSGSSSNLASTPVLLWGHKTSAVDVGGFAAPTLTGMVTAEGSVITSGNVELDDNLLVGGYAQITGDIYCDVFWAQGSANITFASPVSFGDDVTAQYTVTVEDGLYVDNIYPVGAGTTVEVNGTLLVDVVGNGGLGYLWLDTPVRADSYGRSPGGIGSTVSLTSGNQTKTLTAAGGYSLTDGVMVVPISGTASADRVLTLLVDADALLERHSYVVVVRGRWSATNVLTIAINGTGGTVGVFDPAGGSFSYTTGGPDGGVDQVFAFKITYMIAAGYNGGKTVFVESIGASLA